MTAAVNSLTANEPYSLWILNKIHYCRGILFVSSSAENCTAYILACFSFSHSLNSIIIHKPKGGTMQKNNALVQALIECARTCDMCADACLNEQDVKMLARCIKLDLDCAEVCYEAVRLVQRNSEITQQFMSVCEKVCTMCYEECNKHRSMHEHCAICADACRKCADACKNFQSAGVSEHEMR